MTVRIKPGKTSAIYIKSNNHPVNIYNTVYVDLRSTLGGMEQRSESEPLSTTHLMTKKNMTDLKRVMNYGRRLHPDDSTSSFLRVKDLLKESFNNVVVYKP